VDVRHFELKPVLVDFDEERRYKPEAGSGVREDGSDSSPTLDLSVYKLQSVDGPQLSMKVARQRIYCEALLNVFLKKLTPFRSDLLIFAQSDLKSLPCLIFRQAVPDILQRLPKLLLQVSLGNVTLCILSKMELATLPWDVWKYGFTSCQGSLSLNTNS